MSPLAYKELTDKINLLSFSDRVRLLEQIAQTLQIQEQPKVKSDSTAFEKAFGLWRDRDIDLETIRQKAWGQTFKGSY